MLVLTVIVGACRPAAFAYGHVNVDPANELLCKQTLVLPAATSLHGAKIGCVWTLGT
jgi:hypothetical protein